MRRKQPISITFPNHTSLHKCPECQAEVAKSNANNKTAAIKLTQHINVNFQTHKCQMDNKFLGQFRLTICGSCRGIGSLKQNGEIHAHGCKNNQIKTGGNETNPNDKEIVQRKSNEEIEKEICTILVEAKKLMLKGPSHREELQQRIVQLLVAGNKPGTTNFQQSDIDEQTRKLVAFGEGTKAISRKYSKLIKEPTVEEVNSLFPEIEQQIPNEPTTAKHFKFTPAKLLKFWRTRTNKNTRGTDGISYFNAINVAKDESMLQIWTDVLSEMWNTDILLGTQYEELLTAVRTLIFSKGVDALTLQQTKGRPIAIEGLHFHTISGVITHSANKSFTLHKSNYTFKRMACQVMEIKAQLAYDEGLTIMTLDATNAYGNTSAETAARALEELGSHDMAKLLRISNNRRHFLTKQSGETLTKRTSCLTQGGCPNTAGMAAVVDKVMEPIHNMLGQGEAILTYVDDGNILGKANKIVTCMSAIETNGDKYNFILNPSKCKAATSSKEEEAILKNAKIKCRAAVTVTGVWCGEEELVQIEAKKQI